MIQFRIIASVVLLSLIGSSFAIRCYKCETTDASCNNPTATMQTDCSSGDAFQNVCYKSSFVTSGSTMAIARGCNRPQGAEGLSTNQCKVIDVAAVKTTICVCNSRDFCNSAGSFEISMTATGISVFLAMILTKFY